MSPETMSIVVVWAGARSGPAGAFDIHADEDSLIPHYPESRRDREPAAPANAVEASRFGSFAGGAKSYPSPIAYFSRL